jgi:hypothetical protein
MSLGTDDPRQEASRRIGPWPWLLALPPAASVIAGLAMAYLAVHDPDSLVVSDYARIEEITEERFARDAAASRLGLSAGVDVTAAADGVEVRVALGSRKAMRAPEKLRLELHHPTRAALDRHVILVKTASGYRGAATLPASEYDLELLPADGAWRLAGRLWGIPGHIDLEPQPSG